MSDTVFFRGDKADFDGIAGAIGAGRLDDVVAELRACSGPAGTKALSDWVPFFAVNYQLLRDASPSWPAKRVFVQLALESRSPAIRGAAEVHLAEGREDWPILAAERPYEAVPGAFAIVTGKNGFAVHRGTFACRLTDGRLAFADASGGMHVLDGETGLPIAEIPAVSRQTDGNHTPPAGQFRSVAAIGPDTLAIALSRGIAVVNATTGAVLARIAPPAPFDAFVPDFGPVVHRATGTILAAVSRTRKNSDRWGMPFDVPYGPYLLCRFGTDGVLLETMEFPQGLSGLFELEGGRLFAWLDDEWAGVISCPSFTFLAGPGQIRQAGSLLPKKDWSLRNGYDFGSLSRKGVAACGEHLFIRFAWEGPWFPFDASRLELAANPCPEDFEPAPENERVSLHAFDNSVALIRSGTMPSQSPAEDAGEKRNDRPRADIGDMLAGDVSDETTAGDDPDPSVSFTAREVRTYEALAGTVIQWERTATDPGGSPVRIVDAASGDMLGAWPFREAPGAVLAAAGFPGAVGGADAGAFADFPLVIRDNAGGLEIVDAEERPVAVWVSHWIATGYWTETGTPVALVQTRDGVVRVTLSFRNPGRLPAGVRSRSGDGRTYEEIIASLRAGAGSTAAYWLDNARFRLYDRDVDGCDRCLDKALALDPALPPALSIRGRFIDEGDDSFRDWCDDTGLSATEDLLEGAKEELRGGRISREAFERLAYLSDWAIEWGDDEGAGSDTEFNAADYLARIDGLLPEIPADSSWLRAIRAHLLFRLGRFGEAADTYGSLADEGLADANAWLELCSALVETGRPDEAASRLVAAESSFSPDVLCASRFARERPSHPSLPLFRASDDPLAACLPSDPARAIAFVDAYAALRPLKSIVRLEIRAGLTGSIEDLDAADRAGSDCPGLFYARASVYARECRVHDACLDISRALDLWNTGDFGVVLAKIREIAFDDAYAPISTESEFVRLLVERAGSAVFPDWDKTLVFDRALSMLLDGNLSPDDLGGAAMTRIFLYVANVFSHLAGTLANRIRIAERSTDSGCVYAEFIARLADGIEPGAGIALLDRAIGLEESVTGEDAPARGVDTPSRGVEPPAGDNPGRMTDLSAKYRFERACLLSRIGREDFALADLSAVIARDRADLLARASRRWELEAFIAPELECLAGNPEFMGLTAEARVFCDAFRSPENPDGSRDSGRDWFRAVEGNRDRVIPSLRGVRYVDPSAYSSCMFPPDLEKKARAPQILSTDPEEFAVWALSHETVPPGDLFRALDSYARDMIVAGERGAALDLLSRIAAKADIGDSGVLFLYGTLLHTERGDLPAALETLSRSLSLDPGNSDSQYERACVRNLAGDKSGALADLGAYLGRFDREGREAPLDEAFGDADLYGLLDDPSLAPYREGWIPPDIRGNDASGDEEGHDDDGHGRGRRRRSSGFEDI